MINTDRQIALENLLLACRDILVDPEKARIEIICRVEEIDRIPTLVPREKPVLPLIRRETSTNWKRIFSVFFG